MKPLPVTNGDLAAFLASKTKKEVYRGFSAFEILAREREIWRFWIYAYAVFAYLAGMTLTKFGDPKFGSFVILIPVPLSFLFQRQRRLDDFIVFFLTRNSSAAGASK